LIYTSFAASVSVRVLLGVGIHTALCQRLCWNLACKLSPEMTSYDLHTCVLNSSSAQSLPNINHNRTRLPYLVSAQPPAAANVWAAPLQPPHALKTQSVPRSKHTPSRL
jgi:hypothetical protein